MVILEPSFMSGFSVLFILVTECSEGQVLTLATGHSHTEVPTCPGLFPRSDLKTNV